MSGTPVPNLFMGRKGTLAEVFEWNIGFTDSTGDSIIPLAKTVRFAPGGAGGEAIFTQFWIAITSDMTSVTLRFTPIIDGIPLDGTGPVPFNFDERQTLALSGTPGTRVTERFEFGMSLPYTDGVTAETLRTALRGTWFQLLIDTVGGLTAGDLILEQPEIEFEIVQESEAAQ